MPRQAECGGTPDPGASPGAEDGAAVDDLLRSRLSVFDHVAIFVARDVMLSGLEILPTGAAPHGDVVLPAAAGDPSGDPADLPRLLDLLLATPHTVRENSHVNREGDDA